MRYVEAQLRIKECEEAYRIYVTDALKALVSNTARFNGGVEMSIRYIDLFKPEETRTEEEVINMIKSKLERLGDDSG